MTDERFLAVRGQPPEAAPGDSVSYDALLVGPDGTRTGTQLGWAFCHQPKALAENDVVTEACTTTAVLLLPGPAASVTAPTPQDACTLFGPDPPPGGYRPRDPDVTGGYYQPVRAVAPAGEAAFGLERIRCNASNVSADVAAAYATQYVPNRNPSLSPLAVSVGGSPMPPDRIPAGAHVELQASWAPADAETFVVIDIASQRLVTQRESMRISWFATAGAFDADRTGRDSSDMSTTSANGWIAPARAGVAHLWVVLRDSRGGVDFESLDLTVVP